MESRRNASLYDAFYFAHSCGRPYQRDDAWLGFFAAIADRIVRDIRPRTVLDAGCAMGFLVEALRDRGVEAFGVDISAYAIQQVRPDIRSHCWVGSVTDPLPQKYDLIVCIEVLEHLPHQQADQAIENFSQHTNEVLFSSTPFDYKEVTHVNVHPPDYWAELFSRRDFFRDVQFDASFVSPWAVYFRRIREPLGRVIAAYERRLWQLEQDNRARRELTLEQNSELGERVQQVQALQEEVTEKEQALHALEAEAAEKAQQVETLQAEVREKERQVEDLREEVAEEAQKLQALETNVAEREHLIQLLQAEEREKERQAEALQTEMVEKERQIQALSTHVADLDWQVRVIESDYGWRLLQQVKKVRLWFLPPDSRRERWFLFGLRLVYRGLFVWPSDMLRRSLARLRRRDSDTLTPEDARESTVSSRETLLVGPEPLTLAPETEDPAWGKQILVVSGSTGDMERYRCRHLCEQLRLFGVECEARRITDPRVMTLLPHYKLVILHRVAHDQRVEHLIDTAHTSHKATVIFDIDDLVFQPEIDGWIQVLQMMSPADQALFRQGMRRYRRTLELCDGVLAATEAIAEAAERLGKPAWIHRNALSLEMLALSEQAYSQRMPTRDKVVIGYASGTRTHNRDFAEVEVALERILQTYPQTELWIIGYLDLDGRWDKGGERVKRIPFMPWRQLPHALASLDINLAPLEMHNLFCASKSELKYFEAAAVGVPTVASRWGAFTVAIRSGDNGFLAATPAEWYDALEQLVTDPALRQSMGEQARADVLRRYTPIVRGQELLTTFETILKNGALAARPFAA